MGIFSKVFKKNAVNDFLEKCSHGDVEGIMKLLEEDSLDTETRLKIISLCDNLGVYGFATAKQSFAKALQRSPIFHERESRVINEIKMTSLLEKDTMTHIIKHISETNPQQVFITGGRIFELSKQQYQELKKALGHKYNIHDFMSCGGSRAMIRHTLATLKRELYNNPQSKNIIIGVCPYVSWFPFICTSPSSYELFNPLPSKEANVAVFLIALASYDYVIQSAYLIAGDGVAQGHFENIVSTNNPQITNDEYNELKEASTNEERRQLLLALSKRILEGYEDAPSNVTSLGDTKILMHTTFSEMYVARGMYSEALTESKEAFDLLLEKCNGRADPALVDAGINAALCYAQLGDLDKAKEYLNLTSKFDSNNLISRAHELAKRIVSSVR